VEILAVEHIVEGPGLAAAMRPCGFSVGYANSPNNALRTTSLAGGLRPWPASSVMVSMRELARTTRNSSFSAPAARIWIVSPCLAAPRKMNRFGDVPLETRHNQGAGGAPLSRP
jgi:hypothetical protein